MTDHLSTSSEVISATEPEHSSSNILPYQVAVSPQMIRPFPKAQPRKRASMEGNVEKLEY